MFASSASAGSRGQRGRSVPSVIGCFSGLHPTSVSSCGRRSFLNIATEKMADPRTSYVVLRPVCTPVPPVRYGSAAGIAGYAPPRIRAVGNDSAHPGSQRQHPFVAGKFTRARCQMRTQDGRAGAQLMTQQQLNLFCLSLGTPSLRRCPRAARGTVVPARVQCPGTVRRHSPRHCLARRAYCGSGR